MEVSRRKINTYGKTNKKVLVHDLFNVSSGRNKLYESLHPPHVEDLTRTRTATPSSDFSEDPETSHQLKSELRASFINPREASAPSSRSQTPASAPSPPVFDLHSSEDEMVSSKPAPRTYKRRKLVDSSVIDGSSDANKITPTSPKLSKQVANQRMGATVLQRNKTVENKIIQLSDDDTKHSESDAQEPGIKGHPKHSLAAPMDKRRSPVRALSPESVKSADSMASIRSTPKRKRNDADAVMSDHSSPSHLGLSSLRLTPGRRNRTRPKSTDLELSDSSAPSPSRSRTRLVDRLDSPKSRIQGVDVAMKDASPRPKRLWKMAPEPVLNSRIIHKMNSEDSDAQPQLPRDNSATSISNGPKIRTYGKQRSHLKEMVPGLDSQSQESSQSSLQQLLSQVDSLTTTSQPKDPFSIESDDDDPGTRLKSIHELRQAGLADRFGRELEAVFEDVESSTKALRIKGLMQLVGKLQKQTVRAMLLGSEKLHRLISLAKADLDVTTASMLLLALMALASSETATAQALAQIYKGLVDLPPEILEERRSISRVARDRNENLSKPLVRDIVEFESHVVDQSHGAEQQSVKSIIVSRIALKTFESLLRRLQVFAERAPEPSAQFIEVAVREIKSHVDALSKSDEYREHIESIRLLVSWLDMTSMATRESIYRLSASQLQHFAKALAAVIDATRDSFPSITQVSISMILELSNGDPSVADQFAQEALLQSLFIVIQEQYACFAKDDTCEKTMDGSKHKSAILALGCLSHLAEHSRNARNLMLGSSVDRSQVDVCVNFFKEHVDDAEEAVSVEQVPLLETYLWTVLLLCTICLDGPLRDHVSASLGKSGMADLVSKAEKFLSLMRTEDAGFFERFSTTVETVRDSLISA